MLANLNININSSTLLRPYVLPFLFFLFLLGTNVTICKTPFSCLNHYGPQSIFARPSIAGRRKEVLFQLHLFLLLIGILCASALTATCKENCHRHIQYTVYTANIIVVIPTKFRFVSFSDVLQS